MIGSLLLSHSLVRYGVPLLAVSGDVLDILDRAFYIVDHLGLLPYIQAFLIVIVSILFIKLLKD